MPRENFFRALWRLNRTWPVVAAALLLLNILGWLVVGWVIAPEVEQARQALARQQELQRQRRAGSLPGESGVSYQAGRQEIERFSRLLLTKEELTLFLQEIYNLAQEAGLDIERISFQPEFLEEQEMLRYTLDFSVTGSYAQIKEFVHGFETSDRIMVLEKMSLSGEEAGEDRVSLGLQLSTYFRSNKR
ncbi:MAG: type 4a pilus biogenesis protein PilO [Syntrophotaleaceae bacterium]